MDNLTHTFIGASIAGAGLSRTSRRATAALVIASNLPDVDSVVGLKGSLYYLEHHRGITHSLPGIAILAIGLAAVLSLPYGRRDDARKPRFGVLLGLSLLGLGLHLFMDFFNSYGVRPFLPWNGRWFYGDLAFIIDPWMWLLLGGGLYLSSTRGRSGRGETPRLIRSSAWIALGLVMSALVVLGSREPAVSASTTTLILWFGAVALVAALKPRLGVAPVLVNRAALVALGGYWILLAAMHERGLATLETEAHRVLPSGSHYTLASLPTGVDPRRRVGIVDTGVELWIRRDQAWTRLSRGLDAPAVRSVRTSCAAQTLFRFYRFPVAEVDSNEPEPKVILRDARYRLSGKSGFGAATLPLGPSSASLSDSQPCPRPAAWAAGLLRMPERRREKRSPINEIW